jgi:hypothetical protein
MWLLTFAEFEKKQKQLNRLMLNLYSLESGKSVKAFINQDVKIPTNFLTESKKENLEDKIAEDDILFKFPFQISKQGYNYISSITLPNDPSLIKRLKDLKLKGYFQFGKYDKLLAYNGFFTERKVSLSQELEQKFQEQEVVELDNLNGFNFHEIINSEELEKLASESYWYMDIEKPMWKTDEEKEWLDELNKLFKLEKKYVKKKELNFEEEQEHENRLIKISDLEKRLTVNVDGVGEIKLYEDEFDAKISFVTTISRDKDDKQIKELFILDPKNEIRQEEYNNYKILKFNSEKELVSSIIEKIHERNPIIFFGQNQVYDLTQTRFAADSFDLVFDPGVKSVKIVRDFVKKFFQRLRQRPIIVDSLWWNTIINLYLQQRKLGTSFKLEALAKHHGVSHNGGLFKKSLTHEQLRYVELRRLAGQTEEIRQKAIEDLLDYTTADLDTTKGILDKMSVFPFLARMKQILPYCTLSEIAFSISCMNKYWEAKHFKKYGNLPYYGYFDKERIDEESFFVKKFSGFKNKRLKQTAGFSKIKGLHENVDEYYFSLEEALSDLIFSIEPKFQETYLWAKQEAEKDKEGERKGKDVLFGFLNYLRGFAKEIFVDYASLKEEDVIYRKSFLALVNNFEKPEKLQEKISELEKMINRDNNLKSLTNSMKGSFRYLLDYFESINSSLDKEHRKMIRPTHSNTLGEDLGIPEIIKQNKINKDIRLYFLKDLNDNFKKELNEKSQRLLRGYESNFAVFEETTANLGRVLNEANFLPQNLDSFDFIYTYLYFDRIRKKSRVFTRKYSTDWRQFRHDIQKTYEALGQNLKDKEIVDYNRDYIFIKRQEGQEKPLDLPFLHPVRHLKNYEVK